MLDLAIAQWQPSASSTLEEWAIYGFCKEAPPAGQASDTVDARMFCRRPNFRDRRTKCWAGGDGKPSKRSQPAALHQGAGRRSPLATREGWCYQHVQAIAVAIDQYAAKAFQLAKRMESPRSLMAGPAQKLGGVSGGPQLSAVWRIVTMRRIGLRGAVLVLIQTLRAEIAEPHRNMFELGFQSGQGSAAALRIAGDLSRARIVKPRSSKRRRGSPIYPLVGETKPRKR